MAIENFVHTDLADAIASLQTEFKLGTLKPEDYSFQVIAYYEAINVRRVEVAIRDFITEVKNLNAQLGQIKNQSITNTNAIVEAIENRFNT